ncbi:MAG: DUF1223 domain-containing protein [Emcibacter sp.]|nr:DUF1223 domain-containing protein [Emcibacter sp.]
MNIFLQMIRILSVAVIFTVSAVNMSLNFAHANQNIVVVELFTSQGCNLCPPADELLGELSTQEDILALGFSVDYWNYLGWKDTFAKPECVARQKKYNKELGKSGVYTPQMVIQGRHDIIGSRRDLVHKIVAEERVKIQQQAGGRPEITFELSGDMINLGISAHVMGGWATIWIIGYDYEKVVDIEGGELADQVRKYHNVVRVIKHIGRWTGQEINLTLSEADLGGGQYDAYAVLLQQQEVGPIIAAAKLKK